MLKLKQPLMSDMEFRREFSDDLSFLADKGKAYITIKCRAGGWTNPELVRKKDEIQVWRQTKVLGMASIVDDPEKYAEQNAAIEKEIGQKMFAAIYESCVVSWDTNIQDDGGPMDKTLDKFMALADVRIKEISDYFVDFAQYVEEISNFRSDIDKATAKN